MRGILAQCKAMQNTVDSPANDRAGAPSSPPAPLPAASPAESQPVQSPAPPGAIGASSVREIGGPAGPEPTRFGDWEKQGRCIDF